MLLSLRVLSFVKAKYCATPFAKPNDQNQEQMSSSIRIGTNEPASKAAGGGLLSLNQPVEGMLQLDEAPAGFAPGSSNRMETDEPASKTAGGGLLSLNQPVEGMLQLDEAHAGFAPGSSIRMETDEPAFKAAGGGLLSLKS